MKKLTQKYKMEKEKSRKSGKGTAKKRSKYFRKIDASNTSHKRGGFRQPRIACSRAYCRRFNACKSGARDDLVSSLNCDRRFRFFKATSDTIAFCTWESAIEQPAKARLKSNVKRCQISAGTHKFKSAVLVSGVPFQKSTLKKHEQVLLCK